MIDAASSPTSPFHISHVNEFTDVTVHPPPAPKDTSDEPGTKKRKISASNGTPANTDPSSARYAEQVLSNKRLEKVQDLIKRECEQLVDCCDRVKLWVNLNMPRIEDGDNFGVQVQEEVLNELHRSQESAYNLRDFARQHHVYRAKLCSKRIKYPNVEDYVGAVREQDERQLYLARQHLHDLRNIYAVLTDIVHKNIAKLRSPKGNNSGGMY
ncbi:proteasome activator pa28 REG alpha/beta subunit [Punctularia strigosozonata HHB-11173 SS5]|uniref:proteasome activator pa28 REG alpha/beta subunit n=1 Tax=Punctularia strigosozonata (strain HHB-11173) TaxID=741275 RepID=UPI00044168F0|nr:proteasome activator pa28 REG alpha/beta subunit [Punctularia strigosozonata HHB-11173 SS5]EIN14019.1 proteasome activator pa28 REG alpha/beta subunit [Punctularia strigosozonata HHB-11173 SS5]